MKYAKKLLGCHKNKKNWGAIKKKQKKKHLKWQSNHKEIFVRPLPPNEKNISTNTEDSNIIVIDEDAQSDYLTKNSENPAATDTIYIDDTAEDSSKRTPDIDIGRIRFGP